MVNKKLTCILLSLVIISLLVLPYNLSAAEGKFGTAINCMDGRVQEPVIEWLKKEYEIDYVDMITEPGPNLILAEEIDESLLESIAARLDISINQHGSQIIAIVGHYDCAGNPKDKVGQIADIKQAVELIKAHSNLTVIGLWVDQQWKVGQVKI